MGAAVLLLYCEPARLCRMRHEKSPQILNDIGQRVRLEGHILDERSVSASGGSDGISVLRIVI
jgi:hypothetical protein